MAKVICGVCGASNEASEGASTIICEACGAQCSVAPERDTPSVSPAPPEEPTPDCDEPAEEEKPTDVVEITGEDIARAVSSAAQVAKNGAKHAWEKIDGAYRDTREKSENAKERQKAENDAPKSALSKVPAVICPNCKKEYRDLKPGIADFYCEYCSERIVAKVSDIQVIMRREDTQKRRNSLSDHSLRGLPIALKGNANATLRYIVKGVLFASSIYMLLFGVDMLCDAYYDPIYALNCILLILLSLTLLISMLLSILRQRKVTAYLGRRLPEQRVSPRALNAAKAEFVSFGHYCVNSETDVTPIYWRVLKRDGDHMLLVSRENLDVGRFDAKSNRWSESELRGWLNGDFLRNAFDGKEINAIRASALETSRKPRGKRVSASEDQVFVLSVEEALECFARAEDCVSINTWYAETSGALNDAGTNAGPWWLRTPGGRKARVCFVGQNGRLYAHAKCHEPLIGIRPAIWVKLNAPRPE